MNGKTYSNKEMADMLGMELKPFMDLMIELGLFDKNGKPTEFALKNGFLVEKSTPDQKENNPNSRNLSLN